MKFNGVYCAGVTSSAVSLASNLNEENIAFDAQNIIFNCTIRGIGTILSWISDDYIGIGSASIQFSSDHNPGMIKTSLANPTTTATLLNVTTDYITGVTEMVSELNITASSQYPLSSVSCQVNGSEVEALNITFQTIIGMQVFALQLYHQKEGEESI